LLAHILIISYYTLITILPVGKARIFLHSEKIEKQVFNLSPLLEL